MEHPGFFHKAGPVSLIDLCQSLSIELSEEQNSPEIKNLEITGLNNLANAGRGDITFFEDKKLIEQFKSSKASVCLVSAKMAEQTPEGMIALITDKPHQAFVKTISIFYPNSDKTQTTQTTTSLIDETATIEEGAIIEAGAIIGKEAIIGRGTRIASGAVIGYRCHIGRNCMVGPNAVLTHSLLGNNVTIHAGAAIGQDGFGYIMGAGGHKKVPQIGRVIIQDNVEIGANTTIDRGALADTIIGEGTKIDNLVQIGHNVVIGCHAVIVSQTGISGSCKIGNYVVMGGQTGAVGHIEIGDGAQIAASSNVHKSVPAKARYGGTPAKPMKQWFKEIIAVEKMVENRDAKLK